MFRSLKESAQSIAKTIRYLPSSLLVPTLATLATLPKSAAEICFEIPDPETAPQVHDSSLSCAGNQEESLYKMLVEQCGVFQKAAFNNCPEFEVSTKDYCGGYFADTGCDWVFRDEYNPPAYSCIDEVLKANCTTVTSNNSMPDLNEAFITAGISIAAGICVLFTICNACCRLRTQTSNSNNNATSDIENPDSLQQPLLEEQSESTTSTLSIN